MQQQSPAPEFRGGALFVNKLKLELRLLFYCCTIEESAVIASVAAKQSIIFFERLPRLGSSRWLAMTIAQQWYFFVIITLFRHFERRSQLRNLLKRLCQYTGISRLPHRPPIRQAQGESKGGFGMGRDDRKRDISCIFRRLPKRDPRSF